MPSVCVHSRYIHRVKMFWEDTATLPSVVIVELVVRVMCDTKGGLQWTFHWKHRVLYNY